MKDPNILVEALNKIAEKSSSWEGKSTASHWILGDIARSALKRYHGISEDSGLIRPKKSIDLVRITESLNAILIVFSGLMIAFLVMTAFQESIFDIQHRIFAILSLLYAQLVIFTYRVERTK